MFQPTFETLYVGEDLSFPLWRGIKGEEKFMLLFASK
jgi:hypothetical protein